VNNTTSPKNATIIKQKKRYEYDTDSAKKRQKSLRIWKRRIVSNKTKQINQCKTHIDDQAKGSSQSKTSAPERGKTIEKNE
jgi:hypothetical protein